MKNCVCVSGDANDSLNIAMTSRKKSNLELCEKCYFIASLMRIINQFDMNDRDYRDTWWALVGRLPEKTPMLVLEHAKLFDQWAALEEGKILKVSEYAGKIVSAEMKRRKIISAIEALCDKVIESGMYDDESGSDSEREGNIFKGLTLEKKSACMRWIANLFPEEITQRFVDSKFNNSKLDCPDSEDGDFNKDAQIKNCQVSDCKGWRKNFFCTVSSQNDAKNQSMESE
jgi:hypothetical protein